MKNEIEDILTQKIISSFIDNNISTIILMTKSDFKKLIQEINLKHLIGSFKKLKKQEKRYMGLKIYITKDLNKGEIIVK